MSIDGVVSQMSVDSVHNQDHHKPQIDITSYFTSFKGDDNEEIERTAATLLNDLGKQEFCFHPMR